MWRSQCGSTWLGRVSGRESLDFGTVAAHFMFDYSLPLWASGRGRAVQIRPILASQDCVVRLRPLTGARTKSKKIRCEEVFCGTTDNHHAIEQADGTPFFIVGDTWYAAGTNRFKWYEDDKERPLGPEAGFKDYLRYRKAEGYNAILIIAAFPAWATDGYPVDAIYEQPGTHLRALSLDGVWHEEREEYGKRRRPAVPFSR